jgi:hypothetical protein
MIALLKQKKYLIIVISLIILVSIPYFVEAKGLVPCGGDGEQRCGIEDVFVLIARVTNWLIAMAGLFAVYEIISAGLWMVLAAGDEEKLTQKKKALSNAVVGFVMTLTAFMFVNTIVNGLLIRAGEAGKPGCAIDFKSPLTYLTIDPKECHGK